MTFDRFSRDIWPPLETFTIVRDLSPAFTARGTGMLLYTYLIAAWPWHRACAPHSTTIDLLSF